MESWRGQLACDQFVHKYYISIYYLYNPVLTTAGIPDLCQRSLADKSYPQIDLKQFKAC